MEPDGIGWGLQGLQAAVACSNGWVPTCDVQQVLFSDFHLVALGRCAAGQHTAPAPAASADLAGRLGHREPRGSGKPEPSPITSLEISSDLAMRFNERRADDGKEKEKS